MLVNYIMGLHLIIASHLPAAEYPPDWVVDGILHVETRSYVAGSTITYIDKRIGAAGERGCFQMSREAFNVVREPGEKFSDLKEPAFANYKFVQYMRWLGKFAKSWEARVMMWNMGPGRRSIQYLQKVKNAPASIQK